MDSDVCSECADRFSMYDIVDDDTTFSFCENISTIPHWVEGDKSGCAACAAGLNLTWARAPTARRTV